MSAAYRWLLAQWTLREPLYGPGGVVIEQFEKESDYGHDPVRSGRDIRRGRDLHVEREEESA